MLEDHLSAVAGKDVRLHAGALDESAKVPASAARAEALGSELDTELLRLAELSKDVAIEEPETRDYVTRLIGRAVKAVGVGERSL